MSSLADRVREWAKSGSLPLGSPCPNRCSFCYERDLDRLCPGAKVPRIPRTAALIEDFWRALEEDPVPVTTGLPTAVEGEHVHYHTWSDFFSQGLSIAQIERLLKHNSGFRYPTWLHTNGADLDLETASALSAHFPSTLRLHFSVVTFNDAIKSRLIGRWRGAEELKAIMGVLCHAKVYLIHLNAEQTLEDVRIVNEHANRAHKPIIVISQLHSHRLHSEEVRALSKTSMEESRRAVELLVEHQKEFENLEEVFVYFPSQAYMRRNREWATAQLGALRLTEEDLVLSSRAAAPVLEREVVQGAATVVGVSDSLGGTTDFATTITTSKVIEAIRGELATGRRINRVVVPDSIWWVQGEHCLEGGTIEDVRRAFGDIEIRVVAVPVEVRCQRLTLQEARES